MNHYLRSFILFGIVTIFFLTIGLCIGPRAFAFMVVVAGFTNLTVYACADRILLHLLKARELSDEEAPELHRYLRGLVRHTSMPCPQLYVVEDKQPNIFTVGHWRNRSCIVLHQGLIDMHQDRLYQALLARELAVIEAGGVHSSSIAACFAIPLLNLTERLGFRATNVSGGLTYELPEKRFDAMLVGVLAPILLTLVDSGISFHRIFQADRRGAEICEDIEGLSQALQVIDLRARNMTAMTATLALASLYFVNPFSSGLSRGNVIATHPSTTDRLRVLRRIERMSASELVEPEIAAR